MPVQKIKFLDVFEEDKNESLILKINLKVNGQTFNVGDVFRKGERLSGIDFHVLRYFDLAVEEPIGGKEDIYDLKGFFPKK